MDVERGIQPSPTSPRCSLRAPHREAPRGIHVAGLPPPPPPPLQGRTSDSGFAVVVGT